MQTDGDEYDEKPVHDLSAPSSRKVSSISEIYDSSRMFLKEYEWTEVEANEPPANDLDFQHTYSGQDISATNYISNFVRQSSTTSVCKRDIECDTDMLDFHKDIMFNIKSKCQNLSDLGLNKLSKAFVSTSFYQKYILPLLPMNSHRHQSVQSYTQNSNKASIHQKIKKLKLVSKNPFMSPLLASDDSLKQMPPVYFIVSMRVSQVKFIIYFSYQFMY